MDYDFFGNPKEPTKYRRVIYDWEYEGGGQYSVAEKPQELYFAIEGKEWSNLILYMRIVMPFIFQNKGNQLGITQYRTTR